MADDGNSQNNTTSHVPHQETFQCTPEAQVEHRYPTHTTGIISLPPGSRGPRSLYLRRQSDSFGFTLRHFIVYPPDSVQDATRQAQLGTVSSPMDTIFVKNVARYSPAEQAGLQHGDRIVAVNGVSVTDKTYAQVIYLIQHSPEYLHLLVVPKEEDVLQKFFAETAHNPISNQQNWNDLYSERKRFHRPLPQLPQNCRTNEFQADALSWKSLQEAIYASPNYDRLGSRSRQRQQRSADNLLYAAPIEVICHNKSEEILDDVNRRSRAQPQVPLYRKMGRRASEGSTISNKEVEQNEFYTNSPISKESNAMVVGGSKMKGSPKFVYPEPSPVTPRSNENAQTFNYPNSIGCRLSLDGRRESTASMSSSLADGSKDSLSSYDSMSTLTGQDTDDSIIMTRLRKNLQQKEEFLRRPSHPAETPGIQREFYGRPKKLEKQTWPPNEHVRQESPSKTIKPVHQNFQRVKADIETERDFGMQIPNDGASEIAGTLSPQQRKPTSKEWHYVNSLSGIKEGSIAPEGLDNHCQMNGAASVQDEDRRLYLRNLQMVTKRTKQFESGKSLPEDDPMFKDRTSFYKSELARISSKRVVPHVTTRAHEFESRSSEPRRDTSGSSTNSGLRRQHRDSRSLDSSGSSSSVTEVIENKLSGNVVISSGSKYIHVPPPLQPPSECKENKDMLRELEYQPSKIRARSNSAESWAAVMQSSRKDDTFEYTDCVNNEHLQDRPQAATNETRKPNLSPPIIPETVESLHKNPLICITHDISSKTPPIRPNQLDLNCPIRPARRRESRSSDSSPRRCSSSENSEENRPVVIRRTKNLNLGDEERAMRRESYLKATGNGRMQVDDFSDGEISPHLLRSAHRKWRPPLFPGDIQQLRKLFEDAAYSFGGSISGNSSSSVSLEREKTSLPSSPLEKEAPIKEGLLYCKIAEIDGKRAADRSWKQVWVVLRESKLFLYKDRHHQSPSEAAEQSLANGVDMSASCVRIAEDYTKRKHVLRVSSVLPCRSELLLQAENPVDLADWVKALQEQVAANDTENKSDTSNHVKQQAVPQTTPALTTIQVQGSSRLSPQPNKSKLPSLRNRSPTGQSPVSKTRKPSQVNDGLVSPKSKTWRGRVAKQFRKIQGGSSPSSPTAPEGSTFGAPLELCFPSNYNQNVPRLVEVCTDIVESKGLDIIGVYRVPGNSAAITALTNSVNQSFDGVSQADPHWNDVHVVSSLLKSFFRKLPDALLTSGLYTSFIEADKIEDPNLRMEEVRKLVRCLPPHHYHTLRHLMLHLKKVTDNCDVNKMEGRNLAIVFGPTLIRAVQDDMATLVNDMTHNYKIVESLICYADWFFSDDNVSTLNLRQPALPVDSLNNELDVVSNRALLLDNISKVEGMKGEKVPGRELFSSIISAAHRKMWKGGKTNATQDSREDSIPNGIKEFTAQSNFSNDLKQNEHEKGGDVPTTVIDMEKSNKQDRGWLNYSNQEQIRRRVENFIQETQANLQRNRRTAEFYGDSDSLERVSNSIHHMNQENNSLTSLPTTNSIDSYAITKTQSASNVFHRPLSGGNRNSNLSHSALAVQYTKNSSAKTDNKTNLQFNKNSDLYKNFDLNRNNEHVQTKSSGFQNVYKNRDSVSATPKSFDKVFLRRGSSVENVNSSTMDITTNGTLKKVKYGNEIEITQRTGSLDSLNKLHEGEDGSDLQATIMKIFDEKKKTLNPLLGTNLPFADESPERPTPPEIIAHQNKENIPASPKIYRNPSLHKNSLNKNKFSKTFHLNDLRLKEIQKEKLEEEKDKDCSELVPDNDRHISNIEKSALTFSNINNKPNTNFISGNSKLRRSESLNKPERTVSPLNMKLKRSESLNKASDRLKRSDSLTKNEKTENNINKRRELSATRRTNKELTKLKRKNGMPERSIKRRHTVGGTKDFDKVNWLDNRCYQEKDLDVENQNKEKCTLRTSSPDLSSARRERLLFEVNLFGPENIVVALRQHLIGVRPQSLPEPRIFTVPLESHV